MFTRGLSPCARVRTHRGTVPESRGDRYLSHSSRHTQVSVPYGYHTLFILISHDSCPHVRSRVIS